MKYFLLLVLNLQLVKEDIESVSEWSIMTENNELGSDTFKRCPLWSGFCCASLFLFDGEIEEGERILASNGGAFLCVYLLNELAEVLPIGGINR